MSLPNRVSKSLVLLALAVAPAAASAADCDTVRMANVGWTDNMAQNGVATVVLKALGYEVKDDLLSLPIIFESLARNDIDVFLDMWLPSMEGMIAPYRDAGTIDTVRADLEGAKFTLATNSAGKALGIADFKDVAPHSAELDGKMYGVEPGNDGNRLILDIIEKNAFGMGDLNLVESSEQAMISEVAKLTKDGKPVVWLAWEPHPMNVALDITYLTGGDEYFGPDFGGATVYSISRKGYVAECPNTGKFFQNLVFSLPMENELMGAILNDGADPLDAARAWLGQHPEVLGPWLEGVTTKDGGDALAAVTAALK
ncbi:choline ABC transporter substrate-binding protein [Tabrizicola sp. J26]|nr:choline ABC transporter substrate-binding protein [Tabrizicola rongguiensis]